VFKFFGATNVDQIPKNLIYISGTKNLNTN